MCLIKVSLVVVDCPVFCNIISSVHVDAFSYVGYISDIISHLFMLYIRKLSIKMLC